MSYEYRRLTAAARSAISQGLTSRDYDFVQGGLDIRTLPDGLVIVSSTADLSDHGVPHALAVITIFGEVLSLRKTAEQALLEELQTFATEIQNRI